MTGLAPVFLLAAATNALAGASDRDLVETVGASSAYAPYQFECRGYSKRAAEVEAKVALGRNFNDRFKTVLARRFAEYGTSVFEEEQIFVLPARRLGPKVCEEYENIVQRARFALAELEARYGE